MDMTQYVRSILLALKDALYKKTTVVDGIEIAEGDYSYGKEFLPASYSFRPFEQDETWGGEDRHFWFTARIPETAAMYGEKLYLLVRTNAADIWDTDNPQIIGYVNGNRKATMDMNHQEMLLSAEEADENGGWDVGFYAYSNQSRKSLHFYLTAVVPDEKVEQLYYDMKVLFDACELLKKSDTERIEGEKVLFEAARLLDLRNLNSTEFAKSVIAADDYLREKYYNARPESRIKVHSIGYTHIDVAWKWPIKQTRQKAVRSYQTVLNLMEQYPEYRFTASTPELYEYVREDAPDLFEKILKRIQEGRWEAEGGMWLEPDCNLVSGESLIRQFLYGTQYFEHVLHAGSQEILFLPDVFGYSAALPQIMRGFGISYFMTTKMGWNDTNQFPYDTFIWRGIDGSAVLTHLVTTRDYDVSEGHSGKSDRETTYNGRQNPSQIMGTWQRYQQKELSEKLVTLYGYGDGGGGPTREMLEQSRRMEKGIARVPQVQQSGLREFFHELEKNMDRRFLPEWIGELYLEFHRGTYTSRVETKRHNRQAELLAMEAEQLVVLRLLREKRGGDYPKDEFNHIWKLILRNQFHDILPGSSIHEVYVQSDREYAEVEKKCRALIREQLERIAEESGLQAVDSGKERLTADEALVVNTTGFSGTDVIVLPEELNCVPKRQKTYDGKWIHVLENIPSKGYRIVAGDGTAPESETTIENYTNSHGKQGIFIRTKFYEATINQNGEFTFLYDRLNKREIIGEIYPESNPGDAIGNQILVYEDRPDQYENWNVENYYQEKYWSLSESAILELKENGPVRAVIHTSRHFMDSLVDQDIVFYRHTKRIDFKTHINWRQHQLLMRVAFPVTVMSSKADFEIQFGNVERTTVENTSWDKAQFEVCAHKWMDLSDTGYGVALLNNCRYGCRVHHNVLSLSLIRNGSFPDTDPDTGEHDVTYSLYPHLGDFREGNVIEEAYRLNEPCRAIPVKGAKRGKIAEIAYSLVRTDDLGFILETIKQSEDGASVICRGYEAFGRKRRVKLRFAERFKISKTSLSEELSDDKELVGLFKEGEEMAIELELRPYEIVTLRLEQVDF